MTLLSLAAGLAGCAGFLHGGRGGMVGGAVGFWAANVLDECDGAVARATGASSGFGSWFDTLVGSLVHIGFFLALGFSLSRSLGQSGWMLLGLCAALGVFASTAGFVAAQAVLRGSEGFRHPDPPRSEPVDRLSLLKGTLRTDFSIVVLFSALLGRMEWILWGASVGTFLFWIPSDFWRVTRLRRGDMA